MENKQRNALAQIALAVFETVKESGPMGAPGGHIYAALMAHGVSLETFNAIMGALEDTGKVVKRGQCYFPT